MDLRLTAKVAATEEERAAIASVLGPPESGWQGGPRRSEDAHAAFGGQAARARHHLLITVLHALQEQVGWISPGALDHVAERLTIAPAVAYGVASFYALFRTEPSPGAVVHVCDDVACAVNGAERLCAAMTRRFGGEGTETAFNGAGVTWQRSPCLGQCDRGSAALIQQAGARPRPPRPRPRHPRCCWSALTGQAEDQDPVISNGLCPPRGRSARLPPGRPGLAAAPGRPGRPRRRSARTGRRAATRCSAARSSSARRAWSARSATPS